MRRFACLLLLAGMAFGADNQLTPEEKKQGWALLFDGSTFKHWQDPAKKTPPGDAWTIEDGCLKTLANPRITEDLVSDRSYGDFELQFDWKVSERGNTGLKYRLQRTIFLDAAKMKEFKGTFEEIIGAQLKTGVSQRATLASGVKGQEYTVAFEFQLIDDERHPDARRGVSRQTGALYSMIEPSSHPGHPAGEWNHGLLVLKGNHVEHWVNGVKVIDASLEDEQVRAAVAKRWKAAPEVLEDLTHPKQTGAFMLQNHGDVAWFKNIKIHELKKAAK